MFTDDELNYLQTQQRARLATMGPDGGPQVRPDSPATSKPSAVKRRCNTAKRGY